MTSELRQRAEKLFEEALDKEPAEREAFLASACAGDSALRAEVERLLGYADDDFPLTTPFGPIIPTSHREEHEEVLTAVGPYQIKDLIGHGAFGRIYLAVRGDGQYQGRVAVKVLKRGMDTEDILRRFRNERHALAGLRKHPNIVTLLDGGSTDDGRPYFVMEYVEGRPLDQYCDEHQLTIDERLRVFVTVCSAVQYAHKHLIIHRDLKPNNILVTRKDEHGQPGVKLLDFGIAKFLNPEFTAETIVPTLAGQRPMTPQYASPEQVRGGDINVTSDVYALGVILYELLTGHLPYLFNKSKANIEKIICEQEPEKPSTKITRTEEVTRAGDTTVKITPEYVSVRRRGNPAKLRRTLAGDLDNIVLKALQKDPERRYQTVLEFAQDIENYLAGNPVRARGNSLAYRAGKLVRKHKGKFAVAAAVFVALATLTGWALAERNQAREAEGTAKHAQKKAEKAEEKAWDAAAEARRQQRRAERIAFAAHMKLAQQAYERADLASVLALLKRHERPQSGQDLRSFEYNYFQRLCHSDLRTWEGQSDIWCVAFAPHDKTLAAGSADGNVSLWNADTGLLLHTFMVSPSQAVLSVAFSPDGKMLATGSNGGILKLWDLATRQEKVTFPKSQPSVLSVAFSLDGNTLASGGADGTVQLWDVAKPANQKPVSFKVESPERIRQVYSVAFSPDGKTLAAARADKTVRLWDMAKGPEQTPITLQGHTGAVYAVAFDSAGKTLASGCEDATIKLWDVTKGPGQTPVTLQGHTAAVRSVAFCPDGKEVLASASRDTTVRFWDPATGRELSMRKGHAAAVSSVAFAPGGKTMASGSEDRTVKLWDAVNGPERAPLQGPEPSFSTVAFAPSGNLLARGNEQGTITLWDMATGEVRDTWKAHADRVRCVLFSPNGKWLASAGGTDRVVRLWEAANGEVKELASLKGHGMEIYTLAFSPDGKLLASGSMDQTVKLWDVAAGKELASLAGHRLGVQAVAFAPDGQVLAAATGEQQGEAVSGVVKLWRVTGEELYTLREHTQKVTAVAFAPDGKTLATGSADKTVLLWDVSDRTKPPTSLVAPLLHASKVCSLAFAPDGTTLASGSTEVRLWDPVVGEERATFAVPAKRAFVAFAPNGETLVSGNDDGTVKRWQAPRKRAD